MRNRGRPKCHQHPDELTQWPPVDGQKHKGECQALQNTDSFSIDGTYFSSQQGGLDDRCKPWLMPCPAPASFTIQEGQESNILMVQEASELSFSWFLSNWKIFQMFLKLLWRDANFFYPATTQLLLAHSAIS